MDAGPKWAVGRMPLAEGVQWVLRYALDDERLQGIWDEHRGRSYDKTISFALLVWLTRDALMEFNSGHESFVKHPADSTRETSVQAAYGKLGRTPVAVSQGLLLQATRRLRELFPDWACWQTPASLRAFRVLIYDSKAIKRVAKRLKSCRGAAGGLLGGSRWWRSTGRRAWRWRCAAMPTATRTMSSTSENSFRKSATNSIRRDFTSAIAGSVTCGNRNTSRGDRVIASSCGIIRRSSFIGMNRSRPVPARMNSASRSSKHGAGWEVNRTNAVAVCVASSSFARLPTT